jgi:ornithine cyclodeaminase/alanine dehydrogenase-like protein (mu-crystallin family)
MSNPLDGSRTLLYLSNADVVSVGPSMVETIPLVESILEARGRGELIMPPKVPLFGSAASWYHAQLSYSASMSRGAIKWQSGYPANLGIGLPSIMGLLILNDGATGAPLVVMESTWLTAQRTGAVSAVTAKSLGKRTARGAALIGCGKQAQTQLEALSEALPLIESVYLYDTDAQAARRFEDWAVGRFAHLGFHTLASARAAVEAADIVVTMGPIVKDAVRPIEADWLQAGALGLPLDYDCYWSAAALRAADRYFVDDLEQYNGYRTHGDFFQDDVTVSGDLPHVLVGQVPGRESDDQRIISMNLGLAVEDLVMAVEIARRAEAASVGQRLPL